MLVYFALGDASFFAFLPDAKPKIFVRPNAKPRRQSMEYRLRWVPTQNAGVGHVYFIFLWLFHLRLGPNANPISGGIWA